MKEVKIWKEENGPFCSPYRRYPPMPYDIAKAWPENVYVPPGRGSGKQDYSREPPGDYICNRCNKRGTYPMKKYFIHPLYNQSPKRT